MWIRKTLLLIAIIVATSCADKKNVEHTGQKTNAVSFNMVDSLIIPMDSTSLRGNFFVQNDVLCFADTYYNRVYRFVLPTAKPLGYIFNKGRAQNEISNMMFMYPVTNTESESFFVDQSGGLFTFNDSSKINRLGTIPLGMSEGNKDDFESPLVYGLMEISDFDLKIAQITDSTYLLPITLLPRNIPSKIEESFEKAHIFCLLNINTMEVEELLGKYPEIYRTSPTNKFDFFSYDIKKDTIYVNHCIDSLIYVYKYPDQLLYTIGYECDRIDRSYTIGCDLESSVLGEDLSRVGFSTQINYVPETDMLIRIMNRGASYGNEFVLQAYKNNNLVAEVDIPSYFSYLTYSDGYYYGVDLLPVERDGKEEFMLYRFTLK